MKKIVFFLFIFNIILSSCTKDYTCSCTLTYQNGTTSQKTQTLIKMQKRDAKKICIDYEETKNGSTTKVDCELK